MVLRTRLHTLEGLGLLQGISGVLALYDPIIA
jgi:hypothetical protein